MNKAIVLLSLVFGVSACGNASSPVQSNFQSGAAEPFYQAQQSRIIGANDLIKVNRDGSNVDANLRNYLNGFGIISLGQGVCSGTHIGNGYVITAGHCLLPEGQLGSITKQECSTIKVYWSYRGSPETGSPKPGVSLISNCTQVIYAERSQDRDFAIFKVDQAPSVALPLSKSLNRALEGTKLTIFGYPQGRPLEWSQYCKLEKSPDAASEFTHKCDTEPGNSGSSVLAINSKGVPMVIGIHNAGTDQYNIATHLADALKTLKSKVGLDLISATQSQSL